MTATSHRLAAGLVAVCALVLPGCSNDENQEPQPIQTPVPDGGAAARFGDVETVIPSVTCAQIQDTWSMSGGGEDSSKVAVVTSADKQKVLTASVVLNDGRVAQVNENVGEATITWDGDSFTVSGKAELLDLREGDKPAGTTPFTIKSKCA